MTVPDGPKIHQPFSISTSSSQLSILTFEPIDSLQLLHKGGIFRLCVLGAQTLVDYLFPGVELIFRLEKK